MKTIQLKYYDNKTNYKTNFLQLTLLTNTLVKIVKIKVIISCVFIVFITADIGNQYYGENHPMKPHRIRLTHNLMMNYGLHKKMLIYVSYK